MSKSYDFTNSLHRRCGNENQFSSARDKIKISAWKSQGVESCRKLSRISKIFKISFLTPLLISTIMCTATSVFSNPAICDPNQRRSDRSSCPRCWSHLANEAKLAGASQRNYRHGSSRWVTNDLVEEERSRACVRARVLHATEQRIRGGSSRCARRRSITSRRMHVSLSHSLSLSLSVFLSPSSFPVDGTLFKYNFERSFSPRPRLELSNFARESNAPSPREF